MTLHTKRWLQWRCVHGVLGSAVLLPASAQMAPAPSMSHAAVQWQGSVVRVIDGDTVHIQPSSGGPYLKVRIKGIDAPEMCQHGGPLARDALVQLTAGQPVWVRSQGTDDYGRTLAYIAAQGQDVGAWMVAQGLAWSYNYGHETSAYAALQAKAQSARMGLFGQANPMPPREFRQKNGPCATHRP